MTVPVSYQVIADLAGGFVPEADVLSVAIARDAGEIFSDLRASEMEIVLDNQHGLYSPDFRTGPYSLALGGAIRVEAVTDVGSIYGLFNGFVRTFASDARLGKRRTVIRAMDVAQYLRRDINTGLLIGANTAELLSHVMSDAALPSSLFALDHKLVDVHPFAFMDDISAGEAVSRIVESGAHYTSVDGAGIFAVRNRNIDLQAATVASYENFALEMRTALDDRTLMNDVRLRGLLRQAATDPTTVAGIVDQRPTVPASGSFAFFLQYQDPVTLETPLPVNSLTTTLTGSDFVVTNSAGTDVTASMSLSVTPFALSAKLDLFNGTGDEAFVDALFLTGYPMYRQSPFQSRAEDAASQAAHGRRAFGISSELFENVAFADAYAQFLDFRFSTPLAEIIISQRNLYPDVIAIDLLDTIHIQNSHTAINSTFLVLGIEHAIDFEAVGTVHSVSYRCRLQQPKAFLILDDATLGKLDDRTMGF